VFVGVNRGKADEVGIDKTIHAAGGRPLRRHDLGQGLLRRESERCRLLDRHQRRVGRSTRVDFSGAGAFTVVTPVERRTSSSTPRGLQPTRT